MKEAAFPSAGRRHTRNYHLGMPMRLATALCLTVLLSKNAVVHAQSSDWTEDIGQVPKNTTISGTTTTNNDVATAPTPPPAMPPKSSTDLPRLLWSDEFDATSGYNVAKEEFPNPAIWDRDVGVGEWGWGNDEYQFYTDASTTHNAVVRDGALHIIARRETNNVTAFTSARLKTDRNLFVQYGTIEARIQIPNLADGLWAGFWTLGQNFRQVGWPKAGEIDIMEIGDAYSLDEGNGNKRVISAVHMARANQSYYYNYTWTEARPVDLSLDYHLYKLEWTPTSIEMYVDDYRTHYFDIDINTCDACEELHQPHYLIFNLAVGGNYNLRQADIRGPERITAPLPAAMKIDYIRIYDNGYSNVWIPTAAPITAAPISAAPTTTPSPTARPSRTPTAAPTTLAPVTTTKSPIKRSPSQLRPPTVSPVTVSPTTKPSFPIVQAPTKMPEKKIFNTKSPTDTTNVTDQDFSSIASSAGPTCIDYYSAFIWFSVICFGLLPTIS